MGCVKLLSALVAVIAVLTYWAVGSSPIPDAAAVTLPPLPLLRRNHALEGARHVFSSEVRLWQAIRMPVRPLPRI